MLHHTLTDLSCEPTVCAWREDSESAKMRDDSLDTVNSGVPSHRQALKQSSFASLLKRLLLLPRPIKTHSSPVA
jgi:hypothetical protein